MDSLLTLLLSIEILVVLYEEPSIKIPNYNKITVEIMSSTKCNKLPDMQKVATKLGRGNIFGLRKNKGWIHVIVWKILGQGFSITFIQTSFI